MGDNKQNWKVQVPKQLLTFGPWRPRIYSEDEVSVYGILMLWCWCCFFFHVLFALNTWTDMELKCFKRELPGYCSSKLQGPARECLYWSLYCLVHCSLHFHTNSSHVPQKQVIRECYIFMTTGWRNWSGQDSFLYGEFRGGGLKIQSMYCLVHCHFISLPHKLKLCATKKRS